MNLPRLFASLLLLAALGGCASSSPRMQHVREFAAESAKLGAYTALTERYRHTYQREQAYLSADADALEHAQDARRRAACDDFLAIEHAVRLYMRTLGTLAGDNQYDLEDQVKSLSGAIKAWPDTGLDERHVQAYAGLSRLLLRVASNRYQDRGVQAMVREGQAPLREMLGAMRALLGYYDKSNDNEQRIVLGLLEVELAYAHAPKDRLLATLARVHQQTRLAEYRLAGLRLTLAARHLDAIAHSHELLALQLDRLDTPGAASALDAASARLRQLREAPAEAAN